MQLFGRRRSCACAGLFFLLGCGESADISARESAEPAQAAAGSPRYGGWSSPLARLPSGSSQTQAVCARPGDDAVRDLFCRSEALSIGRFSELAQALGIEPSTLGNFTYVSATAHSTALAIRSVSAINPRVIFSVLPAPQQELLALGFTRGEQYAEIAVRDRGDRELRFYVVGFTQDCNRSERGCLPGDLLTEAIEQDWRELTLYDEATLSNTTFDCATCHQPEGPGTPKLLRMQELETPWTHWLFRRSSGGSALMDDFMAAHGDEPYAGLPSKLLDNSTPGALSMLVSTAGNKLQPNMFDSFAIESEVQQSAAANGGKQPADNSVPGESGSWRVIYERAQRGEAIPVPYHDVKVSDQQKLERMTAAYQAYRRGELPREELPDIRDVFPDDPVLLAEMGMATEPGLDGQAVLVQACAQCHNERLDQSLSRARFRPNLNAMSRQEKDLAIARLKLPADSLYAMPPAQLRVLSEEARAAAIEALSR